MSDVDGNAAEPPSGSVDEIPDFVHPGDIIDGKYRVEARLGAGGMGVVVAARHVSGAAESVAVKLLYPAALANPEAIARFSREAKAASRLTSEHAVKVLDVGKMPSGAPYLVMERLEGADLAGVLGAGGPLGVELAADYLLQACEALAEAHALGIVHRDLKSSNLFLTKRADGSPCVKVLDFGISKMLELENGEGGTMLTATQAMLGSPAYMPPEQLVSAKRVDARSDVWGLGVIFYELITGALPFDGASMMQLFMNIARAAPIPLPDAVPREVGAVIFKCLEKMPADRFADAEAFANAIAPFAASRALTSLPRMVRLSAAAAARALPVDEDARTLLMDEPSNSATGRTPDGPAPPAPRGPSRLALLAAGMALSLALFGGAGLIFVRLEPSATTPSAEPARAAVAPLEPRASAVAQAAPPPPEPSATSAASTESASPTVVSSAVHSPNHSPSAPAAPKAHPRSADPFDTRN